MPVDTVRVSVLLPFRDAEAYLDEAIGSIARQTFEAFECLLIDDGSTDASASIAERWQQRDSRFRLIQSHGVGLAASLNRGLAEMRGEYAARMDGDDIAMPHRLERQVRFMDGHREVIASGAAVLLIDEAGRPMFVRHFARRHEAIDQELLRGVGGIAHPVAILRVLGSPIAIAYDEEYPVAQDRELWLRLAEVGPLANLTEPLLAYRQHTAAVAARQSEAQHVFTRRAIAEACERRGIPFDPDRIAKRENASGPPFSTWSRRSFLNGRFRAAIHLAEQATNRAYAPPLDVRLLSRLDARWPWVLWLERMAAPCLTWVNGALRGS